MGEFDDMIRKPRWRTRVSTPTLWAGVIVTFAAIVAIGWGVLAGVMWGLDAIGVQGPWRHATWIVPTLGALVWALRWPDPATASEDEEQPWSDYAVRAVMIGIDDPRPAASRVATGLLFGAPLVVYLTITVLLEALGFF